MSWPRPPISPRPVKIDWQAREIATWLDRTYAATRGGKVKVIESMFHIWEEILSASDAPRILICCTGENPRGSFAEQDYWGRVDRQWTVVIIRGRGFRHLEPNEADDPKQVPAVETLNTSIEAVRDQVRKMQGVSEEFPINYKGWKPIPAIARPNTANVFVAGAFIEYSTANDIGVPTQITTT